MDLEREVFGNSDSELSDLDDAPVQRQRPSRDSPAVEQESSGGESEDDYVQEKRPGKPKRRSRRGDEAGGRKAQKKRKRKQPEEIDWDSMPPEQAAKMKLDMQIEAILKPKKASRPKRKKKDADEDVLDRAADEEVSRLRETMLAAAADDEQANRDKLPATSKLRHLAQVLEVLRKTALAQSIIDNNLLEGVRRWLEPLPDRSLPALDIQKEFFPILRKMEFIDTNVLKESRLGRVVIFYTKCKRVAPDIARMANDLVSVWSRPIVKRSASYRDRVIPTADAPDRDSARSGERLNTILARAREADKDRVRKNAVMIPQRELGSYTVAPKSSAGLSKNNASVDVDTERRKKNAERLRSLTRKITTK
ncbi:Transcription factor iws1 [Steccherinum ochraceum]|uniref:Transcription factor iws1 n=1 Tax=Steccherinum ochraceum TaxID=92696 RepID=A0A4R0RDW5_9APHY|nr:Transcription factor iws1 [Steccherinum ochraceum]